MHIRDAHDDQGTGVVAAALKKPLDAQIRNARASRDNVLALMASSDRPELGFNALKLNVTNLQEDGVLDASEVLKRGLQIAFAHARKTLQTGAWEITSSNSKQPDLSSTVRALSAER
jgi:chaperonin GroEL (HSP60 family)